MNICFWRQCLEEDEIEIKIERQIYSNIWGAINIFVANSEQKDMLLDDEYIYRLGNFCKDGVYLRINNRSKSIPKLKKKLPLVLKIVRQGDCFSSYCKWEENEVLLNTWKYTSENGFGLRIGFEVKLNDNAFFDWKFSNYIQIWGDLDKEGVKIDYMWNPKKNWYTYTTNYFLDYNVENNESIACYGVSRLEYVKRSIEANRYIELWINEDILDGVRRTQNGHFHQNLIYGYDDYREELYVLQYVNGYPKEQKMSFEMFESEENISDVFDKIVTISYNPDYAGFELSCDYIKIIMNDYLKSINTELTMRHLLKGVNVQHGIKILDSYLTDKGIIMVMEDFRISYLLYERTKCMQERIEYFYEKGIFDAKQYNMLIEKVDKACEITKSIKNLVVLNLVKKREKCKEKIVYNIQKLKILEEDYIAQIIRYLS